jgi:hypothetical protein
VSGNPNSALRCTYRSASAAPLVWTKAILGSDAITLAIAARNPFASTANNGGIKSLLASALQSFECDRAEIWRAEKAPNPFRSNHQDHTHGNDRHNRRHREDREHYLHLIISQQQRQRTIAMTAARSATIRIGPARSGDLERAFDAAQAAVKGNHRDETDATKV